MGIMFFSSTIVSKRGVGGGVGGWGLGVLGGSALRCFRFSFLYRLPGIHSFHWAPVIFQIGPGVDRGAEAGGPCRREVLRAHGTWRQTGLP